MIDLFLEHYIIGSIALFITYGVVGCLVVSGIYQILRIAVYYRYVKQRESIINHIRNDIIGYSVTSAQVDLMTNEEVLDYSESTKARALKAHNIDPKVELEEIPYVALVWLWPLFLAVVIIIWFFSFVGCLTKTVYEDFCVLPFTRLRSKFIAHYDELFKEYKS